MREKKAVITTAEVSDGARAFVDALSGFGYDVSVTTLLKDFVSPAGDDALMVDRSLPPYDLPVKAWGSDQRRWWNRPDYAWAAWDKSLIAQAAVNAGLPFVTSVNFDYLASDDSLSGFVSANERAAEIVAVTGLPAVVKPLRRTVGEGVVQAVDVPALRYEMAHLGSGVVQPFIPEASSTVRAVVAAGRVISAYSRTAPEGAWRSNVWLRAKTEPATLSSLEEDMSVRILDVMGLDFAGVDLIRTNHYGPLLLEVNPAFGVAGLQSVTSGHGVRDVVAALLEG